MDKRSVGLLGNTSCQLCKSHPELVSGSHPTKEDPGPKACVAQQVQDDCRVTVSLQNHTTLLLIHSLNLAH